MKKKTEHKNSSRIHSKNKKMEQKVPFLLANGIRPTRQRLGLSALLFDGAPRHVTAEQLMLTAKRKKIKVSLATIYNSLHEFVRQGILSEVCTDGSCRYFDTNLENHSHFFDEKSCRLWDIEPAKITVSLRQAPPQGMEIDHIKTEVYLKKAR